MSPDSQASLYLREYERMRALGGLYMFSYHSNMMSRPQHVGALGSLARSISTDEDTWLATAGEAPTSCCEAFATGNSTAS